MYKFIEWVVFGFFNIVKKIIVIAIFLLIVGVVGGFICLVRWSYSPKR